MWRGRRLWIILLATPFVLAAADTAYWYLAERNLQIGFSAWLAGRRQNGWAANGQATERGGWPLAATLTVHQVSLHGGDPEIPGGLTWSADRLALRVALWRPRTLEIAAKGGQKLRLAEGPTIPFTADEMGIAMPLEAGAPPSSLDFVARNLRVAMPTRGDANAGLVAGSVQAHLAFQPDARQGAAALEFALHAQDVGPPPGVATPLGPRITSLAIVGAVDGPVPTLQALSERAGAWRDAGGTLEIQHVALTWGPLNLTASATLSLDEQLQPMGAGSARVVGYAETLDALAAHNAISKSAATAAKAVLSLLAHNPEDGSPPDVDVPLTLQYRTLSMRQVPLVRLPELDWP